MSLMEIVFRPYSLPNSSSCGSLATEHNLSVKDHELHAPPVDGFFRVNAHADFIVGLESGRNELAVLAFGNAEEVFSFHVPAAGRVANEINVGRVGFKHHGVGVEVEEVPSGLAYHDVVRSAQTCAGMVGEGELCSTVPLNASVSMTWALAS